MDKKVLYIGNFLTKHGFTPNYNSYLCKSLELEGIEFIKVSDSLSKTKRLIEMVLAPIKYRRQSKIVLIDVFSTSAFWFAFFSAMSCKLTGLRYITLLHGGNLPNRLKNSKIISKWLFENSFKNISPSKYLLRAFEEHSYQVEYLPNFVDSSLYQPYRIERNYLTPHLFWLRAFDEIYNPEMAILAFEKVKLAYPDSTMIMVGPDKNGSMKTCKQLCAEKGISESVSFTGQLSLMQWLELSKLCNIWINTPNFDNMPVSIIEALTLGFPIVSTNVGGLPFLLEDGMNGILVQSNDHNVMAREIIELFKNPRRLNELENLALNSSKDFEKGVNLSKWQSLLN